MSDDDIGIRLREMRTRRGLSLAQLSARSGIGIKSISSWENGRSDRIPMESLLALTGACEISPAVFFLFDLDSDDFALDMSMLGYRVAWQSTGAFLMERPVAA